MKRFSFAKLVVLSAIFGTLPGMVQAMDVMEIIKKVDNEARDSFSSAISNLEISTCKYRIENRRLRCSESPRIVYIENVQKDYGPDLKDSRSLAMVLKPVSDEGIGMLTYQYYDYKKDNDTWLYLPALGKVRRVISSNDGSGNFFGSEFLNENMAIRKVEEYTYKLLDEATYKKRPAWIVEIVPTDEKARKLPFGRIVAWFDKERFIPLKENIYNKNDQIYLQQVWLGYEKVDGVWVAQKVSMNNLISRRISHLETESINFHIEVPEEVLSKRSLTDFAFREKNMTVFREGLE